MGVIIYPAFSRNSICNRAILGAETAITSAQTALEKVSEIDIDTLNQAITDLSDVVEPMSEFFGMFRR